MYTVNNFKNYVPFSLIDLNSFKAKIEQKIFFFPLKIILSQKSQITVYTKRLFINLSPLRTQIYSK